ncbi:chondroitin synthase [Rubritalea halochordaticola]|uniref:Chondroitin synthase n=1 Tax=Rubritalea halochordaticola TaxID=714537 RepID=A0ABP9V2G4_9BACT
MKASVIISTYNQPQWLAKALAGYLYQSNKNFDIVIADDGSGEETREVIKRFAASSNIPVKHVWHEDKGFRKSIILNKAIQAAPSDYLIFTDGDCIPHPDFIDVHLSKAKPGYFVSAGYCKLSMEISERISLADIAMGQCFKSSWLIENGLRSLSQHLKISSKGAMALMLDAITPTKATWNGCNSSGWKKDILEVNGHNEVIEYGGQDREMGERLVNLGIKPRQLRHRSITLHLDHPRGYKCEDKIRKNRELRSRVRREKITRCANGIHQLVGPELS